LLPATLCSRLLVSLAMTSSVIKFETKLPLISLVSKTFVFSGNVADVGGFCGEFI
jgi:hypothetical protein